MVVEKEAPAIPMTPPNVPAQPEVKGPAAAIPEATKAPEVPEKFKTPEGEIDIAKVEKSTLDAQVALDKYLAKERELKRKINEVKAAEVAPLTPPTTPQQPAYENVSPDFAVKIEQDIQSQGVGNVLAKLFNAAKEVAKEEIAGDITQLKTAHAETTTRQQIEAIGKVDPWVFTDEGVGTLTKILNEQPYLWNAADPYKAAYLIYNGVINVASRSQEKVTTSTPPARPSAPIPTGQASPVTPATVRLDSKEAIDNHLKGLSLEQQEEFFRKSGLPGLK